MSDLPEGAAKNHGGDRDLPTLVRESMFADKYMRQAGRRFLEAAIEAADADGRLEPPWEEWAERWGISPNSVRVQADRLVRTGYLVKSAPGAYRLRSPKIEAPPRDLEERVSELEDSVRELLAHSRRQEERGERVAERTARMESTLSVLGPLITSLTERLDGMDDDH